jgi:septum formation protein
MSFILASASPRRRELLAAAGFSFDIDPVDVDESLIPGESPDTFVTRVALLKARTAGTRHPSRLVVAADTAVVVDDEVFGKPADTADAGRMLRRLSGRSHDVLTGVALVGNGREATLVERTTVWFAVLSDRDIESYVATGEPMDKAGAYAIQGLASRFIPRISGSYANVVGLPVASVWALLRKAASPVAPRVYQPYPE